MTRMENRMKQFDEERKRSEYLTMKTNKLKQMEREPGGSKDTEKENCD